jgi:hypothetical protein
VSLNRVGVGLKNVVTNVLGYGRCGWGIASSYLRVVVVLCCGL